MLTGQAMMREMNDTVKQKMNVQGPLSRADIADILVSIGPPGENREEKVRVVREVSVSRLSGYNPDGHAIWNTLDDFPEY